MHRICCFCERWESGGIESFLNNILLRMDLSHIEVDIVAACIEKSVFTKELKAKGVRFIELSGKLRSIENYRLFRKLLRERKYDVAHFNLYQGLALYYVWVAKQLKVPMRIAHSHNTALRRSIAQQLKLYVHHMTKEIFSGCATDLWACSEKAAAFLFSSRALRRHQCHIIPNGIVTERFQFNPVGREYVRRELWVQNYTVIGNVGRLCYQKNQSFLLDVLCHLRESGDQYRLLLVGEGEDAPVLRAKAEKLGISDAVLFLGVSQNVEHLYWAMDIFAFPSLFEGLGIVAVEAQAASLPVICSEHIPSEAYLTPLMKKVSLEAGAAGWAKAIRQLTESVGYGETRAEGHCHQIVRDAGYDVQDVTLLIQEYYCGGSE